MKKTYTNSDILTMYNTLNSMKGRSDIVPGDANIFWANSLNLQTLREAAERLQTVTNEVVNSFFTDETSHIEKDESGEEHKTLNDECKDEIMEKMNEELNKLSSKSIEIEIEPIPEESLRAMLKANEKTMSFLEMTVMQQFLNEEEKKE